MSKAKFILQTVSGAFGPGDEIPWGKAHEEVFPTLDEAAVIRARDQIAMLERCGFSAWDSYRRIVPTADTTITYRLICGGAISAHGGYDRCPNQAEAEIVVPWPAGEPQPQAAVLDGWDSVYQCNGCATREEKVMAHLSEEFDREEGERHGR